MNPRRRRFEACPWDPNSVDAFDRAWLKLREEREAQDVHDWRDRELQLVTDRLRTDLSQAEEITLETRNGIVYATIGGEEMALEPTGSHHSTIDSAVLRRLARGDES